MVFVSTSNTAASKNLFPERVIPSPTPTNLILEVGHALSRPYELICIGGWGHDLALKMNFQERIMPDPSPGFAKPVGTSPV